MSLLSSILIFLYCLHLDSWPHLISLWIIWCLIEGKLITFTSDSVQKYHKILWKINISSLFRVSGEAEENDKRSHWKWTEQTLWQVSSWQSQVQTMLDTWARDQIRPIFSPSPVASPCLPIPQPLTCPKDFRINKHSVSELKLKNNMLSSSVAGCVQVCACWGQEKKLQQSKLSGSQIWMLWC